MPDPTLQTDPRPTPEQPDAPARRTLSQTQPQTAKNGQSLFVTLRAFEAYDDDIFGQQETAGGEVGGSNVSSGGPFGTVDPRFRQSGAYSGLGSAVAYAKWKQLKRGRLSINGNGMASYEGIRTDNRTIGQGQVDAAASTSVHNWQLGASGGAAYAPFYQLLVILPPEIREAVDETDDTLVREIDYLLLSQRAFLIQGNASVNRTFKRGLSLGGAYSVARTDFMPGGPQTDSLPGVSQTMSGVQTAQQARLTLSSRIKKGVSLRLGYGYNHYEFGYTLSTPPTRTQDIEAGVDYSRPLSFSRRTTLRLSTGSAIAEQSEFGRENRTHRLFLIGNADLTHEMGRTWVAVGAYRRGIDFVAGFREPLLTNTASAGIGGHPTRRVQLTALSYYSLGQVGLRSDAPPYGSTTANARLTVRLTRRVRTVGEYFYDRYHLGAGIDLPPGFAQAFDRRGARATVAARLAGTLDAYAEYIDYRYSFDNNVNLPPGSPRSFDRRGARVGLRLGMPILSPATRGVTQ
jgi:hypothetical protein